MFDKTNNKGVAIVIVLITVLFLSAVALAFIFWLLSQSEHSVQKKKTVSDIYTAEMVAEKTVQQLKDPGSDLLDKFVTDSAVEISSAIYYIDGDTVSVIIEKE